MSSSNSSRIIPIHITEARVTKVAFSFGESNLSWSAQVELVAESGIVVSQIYLDSNSWDDSTKLIVPINLIPIAENVMEIAKEEVRKTINKAQKFLQSPNVTVELS